MPVCVDSPRTVLLDRDFVVDARTVVGTGGGLLMMGQFAGRIDRSGAAPTLDSSLVAVFGNDDGSAVGVPAPRASMRFTDGRAIAISSDEVRVFFHTGDRFAAHDSVELWTGVVASGRWDRVERLGVFTKSVLLGAEVSDGPVQWRGASVFGFAQEGDEVILVVAGRDSARIVRLRTALWGIGDVTVAAHDDVLWIALAAGSRETKQEGDIFLGRVENDSLVDLRRAVVGGGRRVAQPHLLPSTEGLVLSWITEDPASGTSSLSWRSIAESSEEQRIAARWPVSRGAHPFTNLVAAPVDERSAIIVELLPHGYRTIAQVESRALAPGIGGLDSVPYAVSWVSPPESPDQWRIAIHRLGCGTQKPGG